MPISQENERFGKNLFPSGRLQSGVIKGIDDDSGKDQDKNKIKVSIDGAEIDGGVAIGTSERIKECFMVGLGKKEGQGQADTILMIPPNV